MFKGIAVPDVLLSGRHQEIETWRRDMALENTKNRRPDLLVEHEAPPKLSGR